MNQALLAKLAWKVLSCSEELWRMVMCTKYKVKKEMGANFVAKANASQIWKGIAWGQSFWEGV